MTVGDLIEKLNQFPKHLTVEVATQFDDGEVQFVEEVFVLEKRDARGRVIQREIHCVRINS